MIMPYLADFTSKYRGRLIIDAYEKWIKSGERVLDVGCGNGVVSNQIKEYFHTKMTGCDVMNYLIRRLSFVKMDTPDKLPFPDKSFDIVMFNDVLHHTTNINQEKLLKEALRVSRKVLIFEVKPTLVGTISDYLINKIHNPNMDTPFTFRTPQKWQTLFKNLKARYQVDDIKRPALYPFSHMAFRLTSFSNY